MSKNHQHESRILIHFNINENKIQSVDIPWMCRHSDFLERGSNHYYTVNYNKKTNLITIIKHVRGTLVPTYEGGLFSCSAPRNNKDDYIRVDCNGIKANIYTYGEKW